MKKCASCTKDLPEAALHCVFCGAKQPPAPAVQPGLAKTAFGYSNEMMEQLKSAPAPSGGPGPYVPPSQPYSPPPPPYAPPPQPPRSHSPSQQPYAGGLAPQSHANAATVFVQGGPPAQPPQQQYSPPGQPVNQAAFMQTAVSSPPAYPQQPAYPPPMTPANPAMNPGMGVHGPSNYAGSIPSAGMPYQAMRAGGRPVEPWKDALPLLMIVWGIATLVAFATPVNLSPLAFNWDIILHGEGKAKIPMLVIAAIGLLGVILGAIPMVPTPRGILATLLGLSTFVVPIALAGELPPWQVLVPMVGVLLLLPGLLLRNEYVEALLPRVLVTLGVVGVLAPFLIPEHGGIPLVELFKAVIGGHIHGSEIIALASIVFAAINLLVWMPGPATAGGKVFAWIWMLAPLVVIVLGLIDTGHVGDIVTHTPGALLITWVPFTTCAVFLGYGLATVLGKQLE
ncbi:MAG: hypothetical protein ABI591_13925 [Kofleriaceae bacterium]